MLLLVLLFKLILRDTPTRPGGAGKVVVVFWEVRFDRPAAAAATRWPGYMCRPAVLLGRAFVWFACASPPPPLLLLLEASVKFLVLFELLPPTIRKMGIVGLAFCYLRSTKRSLLACLQDNKGVVVVVKRATRHVKL